MMDTQVYDLGDLDTRAPGAPAVPRAKTAPPAECGGRPVRSGPHPLAGIGRILASGLMLLLPGSMRLAGGEVASGLLPGVLLAFLASLAWAIWETRARLAATLELFGVTAGPVVWLLLTCGTMGALVHVSGCVLDARRCGRGRVAPWLAALASAVVPGWGQWARGRVVRAALFLAGVWALAGLWVLDAAPFEDLLGELGLTWPAALEPLRSRVWLSAGAAALWAVALYDAVAEGGGEK